MFQVLWKGPTNIQTSVEFPLPDDQCTKKFPQLILPATHSEAHSATLLTACSIRAYSDCLSPVYLPASILPDWSLVLGSIFAFVSTTSSNHLIRLRFDSAASVPNNTYKTVIKFLYLYYHTCTNFQGMYILRMPQIQHFHDFIFEDPGLIL